jgi:hypothetical protein
VTTGLTPFFANHGYYPEMHIKLPKEASLPDPRFGSKRTAHERLKRLCIGHRRAFSKRRRVRRSTRAARRCFEDRAKVWLAHTRGEARRKARWRSQTARPSQKLDYKRLGPFK